MLVMRFVRAPEGAVKDEPMDDAHHGLRHDERHAGDHNLGQHSMIVRASTGDAQPLLRGTEHRHRVSRHDELRETRPTAPPDADDAVHGKDAACGGGEVCHDARASQARCGTEGSKRAQDSGLDERAARGCTGGEGTAAQAKAKTDPFCRRVHTSPSTFSTALGEAIGDATLMAAIREFGGEPMILEFK